MKSISIVRAFGLVAPLILQACASSMEPGASAGTSDSAIVKPGFGPIPGGYWMYSFGLGQTKRNFENIEIAQSYYGLWSNYRQWSALGPVGGNAATIIGLQAYYPLHVRWKLKDGREFTAENIDVAALMREYFRATNLDLQWQREGRQKHVGDASPLLVHEVKDEGVILKWVLTINRTPVQDRLTPAGVATKWDTYDEEHIVTTIKGKLTKGVEFSKTRELR